MVGQAELADVLFEVPVEVPVGRNLLLEVGDMHRLVAVLPTLNWPRLQNHMPAQHSHVSFDPLRERPAHLQEQRWDVKGHADLHHNALVGLDRGLSAIEGDIPAVVWPLFYSKRLERP